MNIDETAGDQKPKRGPGKVVSGNRARPNQVKTQWQQADGLGQVVNASGPAHMGGTASD